MNSITEYTEFLVKSLVNNQDMVSVQLFESDEEDPIVEIIVHHDDMGALIGKEGRNAKAIKTLVQAFAFLHKMPKVKVNIDSF